MRKIIAHITFFCCVTFPSGFGCNAEQASTTSPPTSADAATYDEIAKESLKVSGAKFHCSPAELLEKIGHPDETETIVNQFDNSEVVKHRYGNSYFFVKDGKWQGFEIEGGKFVFEPGSIRVGDGKKKLEKLFPRSFLQPIGEKEGYAIKVRISGSGQFVYFFVKDGRIEKIMDWNEF